jgi:hypothetical protein
MASHEDVVLALLGASAGLSGLVLVFFGLVASATASFPGDTNKRVIAKARRPVFGVLTSFGLGIACVAVSTVWLLLSRDNHALYAAAIVLFFAQLTSLVVATTWAVKKSLWG